MWQTFADESGECMARTNEYRSTGGAFDKLSDALKSIEERLEEVKKAGEQPEENPVAAVRSFRHVIAELRRETDGALATIMKDWDALSLDPLYLYTSEDVNTLRYSRSIRFLHPVYEHVWLTEGQERDIARELLPFIDLRLSYLYEDKRAEVLVLRLDAKLNLPEFKSSREAAHVDLEMLKEDAKRVELVTGNGEAAVQRLLEGLRRYCEETMIPLDVREERTPYAESEEERLNRLQAEAEEARMAEMARLAAEEKAKRAEDEAKRHAEEEARDAAERERQKKAAKEREVEQKRDNERRREAEKAEKARVPAVRPSIPAPPPATAPHRPNVPPPAPRKRATDSIY